MCFVCPKNFSKSSFKQAKIETWKTVLCAANKRIRFVVWPVTNKKCSCANCFSILFRVCVLFFLLIVRSHLNVSIIIFSSHVNDDEGSAEKSRTIHNLWFHAESILRERVEWSGECVILISLENRLKLNFHMQWTATM